MANKLHPPTPRGNYDDSSPPRTTHPRSQFLAILQSALDTRQNRFARQAATAWLETFPGDLQVRFNLALAHVYEARTEPKILPEASAILEELCRRDPEYLEAQQLRAALYQTIGMRKPPMRPGASTPSWPRRTCRRKRPAGKRPHSLERGPAARPA